MEQEHTDMDIDAEMDDVAANPPLEAMAAEVVPQIRVPNTPALPMLDLLPGNFLGADFAQQMNVVELTQRIPDWMDRMSLAAGAMMQQLNTVNDPNQVLLVPNAAVARNLRNSGLPLPFGFSSVTDGLLNRSIRNAQRGVAGLGGFGPRPGGGGPNGGPGGDGPDKGPYNHPIDPNITLNSVGGLEEQIKYLRMGVLYPIKHQHALREWGVEAPKGILFHGPPGTGKSLLASALANELSRATGKRVSFFVHKGSESLSMYFGQTEKTLRKLFAEAVKAKPSVIFFDEIDGICPNRNTSSRSSPAYAAIVAAMLGLIDSVKRGEVFIIGATNRLNAVDPAILRPGRFDKDFLFQLPDANGRMNILRIHTAQWPQDKPTGPLLEEIVQKTAGYTGADLQGLCKAVTLRAVAKAENGGECSVTKDDWYHGLAAVRASATNVYGSTLFTAEPCPILLNPLVDNPADRIVGGIGSLMSSGALGPNGAHEVIPGLQSFLVWDPALLVEERYHLNHVLQRAFNKMEHPIYMLDIPTINKIVGQQRGVNVWEAIDSIIGQVARSTTPVILFIPQINFLYEQTLEISRHESPSESEFLTLLKKLSGPNQILLATWTGPMDDFPELQECFNDDCRSKIFPPTKEELTVFFGQLFGNEMEAWMMEVVEACVKLTEGDQGQIMVTLYRALFDKMNNSAPGEVQQGLKDVLTTFAQTGSPY